MARTVQDEPVSDAAVNTMQGVAATSGSNAESTTFPGVATAASAGASPTSGTSISADLFFTRGPREQAALQRIVQFTGALLVGCTADLVLHNSRRSEVAASSQPLPPRLDAMRADAAAGLVVVAAGRESAPWATFARALGNEAELRVAHLLPVAPQQGPPTATLVVYARPTAAAAPPAHLDLVRNYAYTALWGLSLSMRWRALQATLIDNRRVSIAAGIVMSSQSMTDSEALDLLARVSGARGVKIRELAEEVIATGRLSSDADFPARAAIPSSVRRACAFIESNAQQQISLADIAQAASVGARRLQTAFRQHLGMTPTEYLRRCRLAGAHDELLAADPRSGLTIAEVAARWGFVSQSHFTATYRRRYRTTPRVTLDS